MNHLKLNQTEGIEGFNGWSEENGRLYMDINGVQFPVYRTKRELRRFMTGKKRQRTGL